ncbi:hypothetical protein IAR55_000724 [Kwoniella newhampshirensis]|uniref:MYND-type domain-containing protein n=1 Tax=Kwoniella newhampshirensis TaxID=1651941 RepID=A0AAW0Z3U4_9TREE
MSTSCTVPRPSRPDCVATLTHRTTVADGMSSITHDLPSLPSTSRNHQFSVSTLHQPDPPLSTLALPRLGLKGSFANLARLVGFTKFYADEVRCDGERSTDHDEDIDDADEDADEEGLLWDAQTALIAHHTDLAIKLYTQAALPPHRSAAACLALGNFLIRGSGYDRDESPSSPAEPPLYDRKGKGKSNDSVAETESPTPVTSRFFTRLFGSPLPNPSIAQIVSPPLTTPSERRRIDLVSSGWEIPKEGKRAVRDVKGMGVAGGWFVLGLGWLVHEQLEREHRGRQNGFDSSFFIPQCTEISIDSIDAGDGEILSFDPKRRKRNTSSMQTSQPPETDLSNSTSTLSSETSNSTITLAAMRAGGSGSGFTEESSMVKTPSVDESFNPYSGQTFAMKEEEQCLKTISELLQPLLQLYRHGHIQPQDPVALPPIPLQQLPPILRPKNENQKGRNVWHLGKAVAESMANLGCLQGDPTRSFKDVKEVERTRVAIKIMGNYLLGTTSADNEAETFFRTVSSYSPLGLDVADDLILQAAKRLNILTSTPEEDQAGLSAEFPFPAVTPARRSLNVNKRSQTVSRSPKERQLSHRNRQPSVSSVSSTLSAPKILSTPIKSSPSVASLTTLSEDGTSPDKAGPEDEQALSTLRRVHARLKMETSPSPQQESRWPFTHAWRMSTPPRTVVDVNGNPCQPAASYGSEITIKPVRRASTTEIEDGRAAESQFTVVSSSPADTLRPVASTPHFGSLGASMAHEKPFTAASTPIRKLPFEPAEAVAPIDPALAAAEMSSALTKHVTCGVCGVKGVNFPECRKCGLTFCSRSCRVDEDKAGNGKKHICGMWESQRLLAVPTFTTRRPSQHMAIRSVSPARATRVH